MFLIISGNGAIIKYLPELGSPLIENHSALLPVNIMWCNFCVLILKCKEMKLVTLVQSDQKAPFLIALYRGVGESATPFPGLLHFTLDPYLIIPFFEFLVWLDQGLNPNLPNHWQTLYSLGQWPKTIFTILHLYLYYSNGFLILKCLLIYLL